jgi:hypothetical protein
MLAPPGIARRWAVIGHTPDRWECTTLFDLPADDPHRVIVHPAAVDRYTIVLRRPAIQMLIRTIETGKACAAPAFHTVHGGRELYLRPITLPNEPSWTDRPADAPAYLGPMELELQLPDAQIAIIFRRERLLHFATILAELLLLLPDPRTDG